jgi:hypothetical protein
MLPAPLLHGPKPVRAGGLSGVRRRVRLLKKLRCRGERAGFEDPLPTVS